MLFKKPFKYTIFEAIQVVFDFFAIFFKMSKNLSAEYYQENKEILQEKLMKYIKILLKKKEKKVTIWP